MDKEITLVHNYAGFTHLPLTTDASGCCGFSAGLRVRSKWTRSRERIERHGAKTASGSYPSFIAHSLGSSTS